VQWTLANVVRTRSLKAEVQRRAKDDLVSINQFVAIAVAEKLAAMNTAAFFAERRERADLKAFDRVLGLDEKEAEEAQRHPHVGPRH